MQNQIQKRNYSILAHGVTPIDRETWEAFHAWASEGLIPMLEQEVKGAGIRQIPKQLPTQPIWL